MPNAVTRHLFPFSWSVCSLFSRKLLSLEEVSFMVLQDHNCMSYYYIYFSIGTNSSSSAKVVVNQALLSFCCDLTLMVKYNRLQNFLSYFRCHFFSFPLIEVAGLIRFSLSNLRKLILNKMTFSWLESETDERKHIYSCGADGYFWMLNRIILSPQ